MPIFKFASKHQWRIYQKCLLREGLYQKSLNSETELFVVKLPLPNVSANTTESSSQCLYFRHEHAAQPGQWQGWEVKDKNAAIFIIASAALQSALYLLLLHSHHLDIVISRFTYQKINIFAADPLHFFCEISYQLSSFAANHTVEQTVSRKIPQSSSSHVWCQPSAWSTIRGAIGSWLLILYLSTQPIYRQILRRQCCLLYPPRSMPTSRRVHMQGATLADHRGLRRQIAHVDRGWSWLIAVDHANTR